MLFLKVSRSEIELDENLIERARMPTGLKGYITNLPVGSVPAIQVIGAYHDLWQVEESFRMTKSVFRARPVFHRQRDSIDAHLSVAFAALAIGQYLQNLTGWPLKKLIKSLEGLRALRVLINGAEMTSDAHVSAVLEPVAKTLLKCH